MLNEDYTKKNPQFDALLGRVRIGDDYGLFVTEIESSATHR
jgi:hypothetical protein